MTEDLLIKAKELKAEIDRQNMQLEKAKEALNGVLLNNPTARTCIRISVPSNTTASFTADPMIYSTSDYLSEYINRLEAYIATLNSEFLAL